MSEFIPAVASLLFGLLAFVEVHQDPKMSRVSIIMKRRPPRIGPLYSSQMDSGLNFTILPGGKTFSLIPSA